MKQVYIVTKKHTFLTEELLFRHLDRDNTNIEKENLFFVFYNGGMGNNVFIHKKVNLTIQDDFFIYTVDNIQFQIFSSVQGVFNSVVNQLNFKGSKKNFYHKKNFTKMD
jgi:hypothetical protein